MGRKSKADLACQSNLNLRQKAQKSSVEDVTDSEDEEYSDSDDQDDMLEQGFFFLDEGYDSDNSLEGSDSDSDQDMDEILEEELRSLKNEQEMHHFHQILREAQDLALKMEWEAMAEKPQRGKHYLKNSVRSKRRHKETRAKLAAEGKQKFISAFFSAKLGDSSPDHLSPSLTQSLPAVSEP